MRWALFAIACSSLLAAGCSEQTVTCDCYFRGNPNPVPVSATGCSIGCPNVDNLESDASTQCVTQGGSPGDFTVGDCTSTAILCAGTSLAGVAGVPPKPVPDPSINEPKADSPKSSPKADRAPPKPKRSR